MTGIKYADNNLYEVITANQSKDEKYIAKTIVLATGVNRNRPNIKGTKEYEGKGISYCAVCDAPFYRNKDVAVLGNGEYALEEINELLPVVNTVTMLTDGKKYIENRSIEDEKVKIDERKIREFRGNDKIEEIEFEDNTKQNIHGIFVAQGTASSLDFARKLGAQIENNYVIVNEKMETTIPNVYACGDCTGGILQISKAMDYKEYGGALFLGVKKPVVKAHGSSDEKLFEFTIKQAEQFVKNKAVEKMIEEFEK